MRSRFFSHRKEQCWVFLTTSVIVVICVVWCMDIYDKSLSMFFVLHNLCTLCCMVNKNVVIQTHPLKIINILICRRIRIMYWCTKDCIVLVDIVCSLLEKVYVYLSYFCQIVEVIFFPVIS